jgi:3-oxoacyl-[acyl-carrier protein] reductase
VALVTGGSRGIGRAIALRLAEAGVHVAINYLHRQAAADEVLQAAQQQGVKALALAADVSQTAAADSLVQSVLTELGGLDFVICNAGVWAGAQLEQLTEALWDEVLATNLKGAWAICRAAVPYLKQQGSGRITIISSTAGQRGEANYSNYAAAKGGQIAFTKSLAAELAASGINVNAIAPGWVETEMIAGALANPAARAAVLQSIPLGRLAQPDDVAWPALFLCSEWARHITGEVLNVNGGAVLCG